MMTSPEPTSDATELAAQVREGLRELEGLMAQFLSATTRHLQSWVWAETNSVIEAEPDRVLGLGTRGLKRLRLRVVRLERRLPRIVKRALGGQKVWMHRYANGHSNRIWWYIGALLAGIGFGLFSLLFRTEGAIGAGIWVLAVLAYAVSSSLRNRRRRDKAHRDLRAAADWWAVSRISPERMPMNLDTPYQRITSRLGKIHRRSRIGRSRWTKSKRETGVLVLQAPLDISSEMEESFISYQIAANGLGVRLKQLDALESEQTKQDAGALWNSIAPSKRPALLEGNTTAKKPTS